MSSLPTVHFSDPNLKFSDKEMEDIQREILKSYENSDRSKKFTVNVKMSDDSPVNNGNGRYVCEQTPSPRSNKKTEKDKSTRKKVSKGTKKSDKRGDPERNKRAEQKMSVTEILRTFDKDKEITDKASDSPTRGKGDTERVESRRESIRTSTRGNENGVKGKGGKEASKGTEHEMVDSPLENDEGRGANGKRSPDSGGRELGKEKRRKAGKRGDAGQKEPKKIVESPRAATIRSEELPGGAKGSKRKGDRSELHKVPVAEPEATEEAARQDTGGQENAVVAGPKHTAPEVAPQSSCWRLGELGYKKRRKGDEEYVRECARNMGGSEDQHPKQQEDEQQRKQQQEQREPEQERQELERQRNQQEQQGHEEQQQQQQLEQQQGAKDGEEQQVQHQQQRQQQQEKQNEQERQQQRQGETVPTDTSSKGNVDKNAVAGGDEAHGSSGTKELDAAVDVSALQDQRNIEAAIAQTTGHSSQMLETRGGQNTPEVIPEEVGRLMKDAEGEPKTEVYRTAAGSSVLEARILGVMTDGSVQELSGARCEHIRGVEALVLRNAKFSAWASTATKNVK